MIYEHVSPTMPIRQGDIFHSLPRIEISLTQMIVADDAGERVVPWEDLASAGQATNIIVPIRPVAAIVATQDCDASRSRDITLCEIQAFREVERMSAQTTAPKKWMRILTQHARINQKWFYLPPDEQLGFSDKMAVDFLVTLRVPRSDLEQLRPLRRGRLNLVANQHFRERIAEFFRRYPYDEWYALDADELAEYTKAYPGTTPFPWQEAG